MIIIHELYTLTKKDAIKYHIPPNYPTVCLGFSKLLEKLVVKYPPDKDYKER